MGTVKVTNIEPIADNGTVTLGGSGDTLSIGSGAITSGFGFTSGTAQATTSGTSVTFSGIPSGTKYIIVSFDNVSKGDGSGQDLQVQLGDSGGIETTGYDSTIVYLQTGTGQGGGNSTSAFQVGFGFDNTSEATGALHLSLLDSSSYTWAGNGSINTATNYCNVFAGRKSLSGELTQLKISFSAGATFDNGKVNILYIK